MKPLTFLLNTTAFTIDPAGYTFDKQSYKPSAACMVAITSGVASPVNATGSSMMLGAYFVANYYSEFNYGLMTIAMGTNTKGPGQATVGPSSIVVPNNFTVTLTNTLNDWSGPGYLGTPGQSLNMLYSTAVNYA